MTYIGKKDMTKVVFVVVACCIASANGAWLKGETDRDPLGYETGEEMTFTLSLKDAADLPPGMEVVWIRTGDDGQKAVGRAPADPDAPVVIKTSLDRPGFVRVYADVRHPDGKPWIPSGKPAIKDRVGNYLNAVYFDGGAGADVLAIRQSAPEPKDFDAFWTRHKEKLAAVSMDGTRCDELPSKNPAVRIFAVSVPCVGPKPATGYLFVPTAKGHFPAEVAFYGYEESWSERATNAPDGTEEDGKKLKLVLSAHGFELNRDRGYYAAERAKAMSNGHGHAFDPIQNADPEKAYFCGMTYRVMRGIEYVKSRHEWNGRDLAVVGGSQGGLQSIWGAALVPGATEARIYIPWCCDMGGTSVGRNHGEWYVEWVPALGYYDPVNMAKRIPKTCRVDISRAGLGDYTCPPSGVMSFWRNLECPRRIVWVQGSTHGYTQPQPQCVVWDRQMPRPSFSFKYGDGTVAGSASMQVDERLKVTVESVEYPRFDATEWVLWFENPSTEKSAVLSEIHDGDFVVSLPKEPDKFRGDVAVPGERAVVTMNGCLSNYATDDEGSATEFVDVTRYFHPAMLGRNYAYNISNGRARSSDRQAPFFEVTQDGQGAVVAIGWTGGWSARFTDSETGVRVEAGLSRARFYLEPGEKLRTSRILVMNYAKGEDSGNKFRRLLRRHFSHVASHPGAREGLLAYELWGGLTSDEMIRRVKTLKAKGLAYEDLWIDAGWYGNSQKCDDAYTGDWADWTGDWIPNPRVHPDGLEKVRDAAKDAGMGLMLWFEPEHVVKTCNFAKEHPGLLLGLDEDPYRGALLYYGNEQARTYVRDLIAGFAERLDLSCYRQDFNMEPGKAMKQHDAPDRDGVTEIRHITGMYRMWDELLARRPQMLIDNCASGGRRIDIETLRRAVAFFRSDYQCGFNASADVLQVHNVGISRLLPYNGCTTKLSDVYTLRSAYSSSYGVAYWNTIFQKEENVDWEAAKKCCDEYRRIRKYFPCDFYNHGSKRLDSTAWAIWQYHDPEANEGVVLAFRRAESPSSRASIPLKGLTKNAMVEVENLDTGARSTVVGELEITLPERRSSTVILYRAQ